MPHNHMQGAGCPVCKKEKISKFRKYPFDRHLRNFLKVHGNKYDYSKVVYKDYSSKIEIICPKHGSFWQSTNAHSTGHGCPQCNESKAEKIITEWFSLRKIPFKRQHSFSDCLNIRRLSFDFYIPDMNMCIEYDGELHYKPYRKSSSGRIKLKATQRNDRIKTEYCSKRKIRLIRISYWKLKAIRKILDKVVGSK